MYVDIRNCIIAFHKCHKQTSVAESVKEFFFFLVLLIVFSLNLLVLDKRDHQPATKYVPT